MEIATLAAAATASADHSALVAAASGAGGSAVSGDSVGAGGSVTSGGVGAGDSVTSSAAVGSAKKRPSKAGKTAAVGAKLGGAGVGSKKSAKLTGSAGTGGVGLPTAPASVQGTLPASLTEGGYVGVAGAASAVP